MPVKIVLSEYLSTIKDAEKQKPISQRKAVPTISELATLSGVTRATFSAFANGRNKNISLHLVEVAMKTLKDCGHQVTFDDILTYSD